MQSLNLRLTRDNLSRPWGFRLQGGFDTGYPLSVQRVFSGSPAEGVLQRGDIINMIDNCDAQSMNSKEIQDIIRTSGRQINFLIQRDQNKENFQDISYYIDSKVSNKTTQRNIFNYQTTVPKAFGDFGTHYEKKTNSLPTAVKLEMNQKHYFDQNRNYENKADQDEEKVDYSFMTLPVNERKKMFTNPDESNLSKTMPRQRSYSFRPQPRTYEVSTKISQCTTELKSPQFSWGPNNEKLISPRATVSNQSSSSSHLHPEKASFTRRVLPQSNKYSTIQLSQPHEPNRRYSSSAQIYHSVPDRKPQTYEFDGSGNDPYKTTHIYRCGTNQPQPSNVLRSSEIKPLYVKTYQQQSLTPSESPRMFRPAYSAFSNDRSTAENWSTISMRSEPYSRLHERNLAMDRPGVYRLSQEPVSMNRNMNAQMNSLQIGEPRTRVIADPASPSLHLNKSFWNGDNAPRINYEPPAHHYYVKTNSIIQNSPSMRREINVPKSHSNVTINQVRHTNHDLYSQVNWLKQHRGSLEGASDF